MYIIKTNIVSEHLLRLISGGGKAEDVHHEFGGDHEGAFRPEALGHQARTGDRTEKLSRSAPALRPRPHALALK